MLKELKPTDCNEAKEHKSPKNSCEVKPSCPEKNKTLSSG